MTLVAYTAEPGSRAQDQLDFLASWSAGNRSPVEPSAVVPPTT
ncbi:MAG: Helix-turn-helix protein [Pseudarthrobacter sp.]|nr:Helix-turn-helix protein [Pseudarthrobacter sp.]